MGREVRFTFKTEEEKLEFEAYAASRGLTLSSLAKAALYSYRSRNAPGSHHALKGRGAVGRPISRGNLQEGSAE